MALALVRPRRYPWRLERAPSPLLRRRASRSGPPAPIWRAVRPRQRRKPHRPRIPRPPESSNRKPSSQTRRRRPLNRCRNRRLRLRRARRQKPRVPLPLPLRRRGHCRPRLLRLSRNKRAPQFLSRHAQRRPPSWRLRVQNPENLLNLRHLPHLWNPRRHRHPSSSIS